MSTSASCYSARVQHRGWHSRGYLPHFDQPGLVQSVNFRLADSLTNEKLLELRGLPSRQDEALRHKVEAWLDSGAGTCILRRPDCASIVENALRHFDGIRYLLLAWCIMPNHVHILLQVLAGWPLDKSIQSIKIFTAKTINKFIGSTGTVWYPDYFDRYIRDEEHFANEVEYIENNPVAAGLCTRPEQWPFSSAGWRSRGDPPRLP